MKCRQLWFNRPYHVEIRQHNLPALQPDEVLVHALCSGISAGTEMLVYRGELPAGVAIDASLDILKQQQDGYPLRYGYASVGRVDQVGEQVNPAWKGRRVFAFQPHASHFVCTPSQLLVLPDSVEASAAVFLANMETAVNLVLDGKPQVDEKVVVLGQGIVGLLTLAILSRFPLSGLFALDRMAERRTRAGMLGAGMACDPGSAEDIAKLKNALDPASGADLVYELTGKPEALNLAVDLCGYASRIITGSWYGNRTAELQLGGGFHRNRISLKSSQVSTIAPELTGRWDKARRFGTAWRMIEAIRPQSLITHRIPFESAARGYELLQNHPEQVLQIVFEYPD